MRLFKVVVACLTAVMLAMPLTSCGKAASKESVGSKAASEESVSSKEAPKKFVVGFDNEFPPMGFVDKDGSLKELHDFYEAAWASMLKV